MSLEIEKRFKNFNYDEIIKILKKNNFNRISGNIFNISNYKGLQDKQSIRVRDEGNKITFTIKQRKTNDYDYDTENEVIIDNYEIMNIMLLEQLKLKRINETQKYREIYKSQDKKNEIIFDNHPALPPFMEIESINENELLKTMKLLDLSEEPVFVPSDLYFENYGIPKNRKRIPLTFDNAKDVFSHLITKNKNTFDDILTYQHNNFFK